VLRSLSRAAKRSSKRGRPVLLDAGQEPHVLGRGRQAFVQVGGGHGPGAAEGPELALDQGREAVALVLRGAALGVQVTFHLAGAAVEVGQGQRRLWRLEAGGQDGERCRLDWLIGQLTV
jgi:hypothetical protein